MNIEIKDGEIVIKLALNEKIERGALHKIIEPYYRAQRLEDLRQQILAAWAITPDTPTSLIELATKLGSASQFLRYRARALAKAIIE